MKKYICVILSILVLMSSMMGCVRNKIDSPGSSAPSDPGDSLLGTEATSSNTESSKLPGENTDPDGVTEPNNGNQSSEIPGSSDSANPSEDAKPSEGTDPGNDTEPPVEPNQGETKPPVTEPPVTDPPVTEPPVTEPPVTEPPVTDPKPTEPVPTEPPHAHKYSKQVTPPTCTAGGYTTYTCVCGDSYVADRTNAKGHTYTDTIVPPTTSERGYTQHICACGYSYIDTYVDPIAEEFTDAELAAAVVKYINEFRKQDGVPELIPQPIMGEIAKIRSEQLLTNYEHDTHAIRKICAEFQYGKYIDVTQSGLDSSYNYYDARLAEAIGHYAAVKMPVDDIAKGIALLCRNSSLHWSYLGDAKMKYTAVGCSKDKYDWYFCIFVSDVTYG